jgi:hypothetical protein
VELVRELEELTAHTAEQVAAVAATHQARR